MAAAAAAMHFRPRHAMAGVIGVLDGAFEGIVKARPAGAALEFFGRHEKPLSTAGAHEGAGAFFKVKGATSRCLRAMRAHDSYCSGVSRRRHSSSVWVTSNALLFIIPALRRPRESKTEFQRALHVGDIAAFAPQFRSRSLIALPTAFHEFAEFDESLSPPPKWATQPGVSCTTAIEVLSLSTTIKRVSSENKLVLSAAASTSIN